MRRGLRISLFLLAGAAPGVAENWPQWRGPRANGVSGEPDLPSHWEMNAGVAWKAPLEGLGTSSPIVWEDLVIVTSQVGMGSIDGRGAEFPKAVAARDYRVESEGIAFLVLAHHRDDGRLLWRHRFEAPEPADALPAVHPKHNLASPSALTDGKKIYLLNESGETVVLKAGRSPEILARNRVEERTLASPAVSNGTIFLRSDASLIAVRGEGRAAGETPPR